MGNWRRAYIVGRCDEAEVPALLEEVRLAVDYSNFHPLSCTRGPCGLGEWPAPVMNVVGNLAERDYSVEDVAQKLQELAKLAPSLALQVHCGGDYESDRCIATITVWKGVAVQGPPVIQELPAIPMQQIFDNFLVEITRFRNG